MVTMSTVIAALPAMMINTKISVALVMFMVLIMIQIWTGTLQIKFFWPSIADASLMEADPHRFSDRKSKQDAFVESKSKKRAIADDPPPPLPLPFLPYAEVHREEGCAMPYSSYAENAEELYDIFV
eukprot:CAMPEP_0175083850 /NCGR_PEP_ID=MMETSP0052_2-20121109/27651_1 /TAXON_ID=51329 ORGANISM="Polytomella parva, Strain SAG 63-3" /NCGR_SAMPLE_ID=MMETSP0052_2 /ASSEMBLY_ACC=CAM_ASM_000194 /LENGTH=125 /DNA_ID=CAMNT_0016355425 /DNA_START=570 /DNA_END=948 /DNA_ORIENTATION=-